jgi:hypothetical protein
VEGRDLERSRPKSRKLGVSQEPVASLAVDDARIDRNARGPERCKVAIHSLLRPARCLNQLPDRQADASWNAELADEPPLTHQYAARVIHNDPIPGCIGTQFSEFSTSRYSAVPPGRNSVRCRRTLYE